MKSLRKISAKDVADAVRYVKTAECKSFATLKSLQKMLACKPMELMAWLEENSGLVHCEEMFSQMRGVKTSIGLCVVEAFEWEEENPWTKKGFDKIVNDAKDTLWIVEIIDPFHSNRHLGYFLNEDRHPSEIPEDRMFQDGRKNKWLWRNTREKINTLVKNGYCGSKVVAFKDYGNGYYNNSFEHYLSKSDIKEIEEKLGFKFIIEKP